MNEKELNSRKVTFTAYFNNEGHRINTAYVNRNERFSITGTFRGYTEFKIDTGEEILVALVFGDDGETYYVPKEFIPEFN